MLSLYKTRSYRTRYKSTDYPVSVKMKDKMYFELNLNTTNPSLNIFVQTCYATMTPDYTDIARYNIIKDR